jgi:hypothetical protein
MKKTILILISFIVLAFLGAFIYEGILHIVARQYIVSYATNDVFELSKWKIVNGVLFAIALLSLILPLKILNRKNFKFHMAIVSVLTMVVIFGLWYSFYEYVIKSESYGNSEIMIPLNIMSIHYIWLTMLSASGIVFLYLKEVKNA